MKVAVVCPNCGTKKVVKMNYFVMILCTLTIVGFIPWGIWWYKQTKCPKCGCVMEEARNIQVQHFKDAEVADSNVEKKKHK